MTRYNTAMTVEQLYREISDHEIEIQDESATEETNASGGTDTIGPEYREVLINAEAVEIDHDTTASELREETGIGAEEIFTYRTPNGLEALADSDVVADYVDDGDEIQTQPIADSEVFGAS